MIPSDPVRSRPTLIRATAKAVHRTASRLKVTEPVRLYLYGVGAMVLVGLALAGYITEEWRAYLTAMAAVLLGLVPATEAARTSVYSLAGHIASLRQLHAAADVQRALDDAA